MTSLEAICACGALVSLGYLGWAGRCFAAWAREQAASGSPETERSITFLRPLKRGVANLREILEANAGAMRATDQLILGVEIGSQEEVIAAEVRAAFPDREIVVVSCDSGSPTRAGAATGFVNPKVAKLARMSAQARHEHWVVADSEAMLDAEFLAAWRADWIASGADVLTAGYRIAGAATWPQRLDAAGLLVTLWPGLVVLRAADALRLTLGACTALRRADLAAVGGWEALRAELAEDNRLGAALAGAGCTIRLSTQVVELASDPLTWRDWWRHQRRVAVTYRSSNPWGYAGSIATHGESWALVLLAAGHLWGSALFFTVWAARIALASWVARRMAFSLPGLALAVLGASLAGSACWVASWANGRVWWGGRSWRVNFRGRMTGI